MPEKETIERAHEDEREGKSPSTQAGEFVREEMHHIREGKHGAASPQQAIAIGLSKARRAGVKLGAPKRDRASSSVRRKAQSDLRKERSSRRRGKTNRRAAAMQAARTRSRTTRRRFTRSRRTTSRRATMKRRPQRVSRSRSQHRRAA